MISTMIGSPALPSTIGQSVAASNPPVVRPLVLVVDDHALFAEAIVLTLQRKGLDARQVALDVPDLAAFVLSQDPHLVLLDLLLGHDLERSLTTLTALTRAGIRVLVVTGSDDRELHQQCVELGAQNVVSKGEPLSTLVDCVRRAVSSLPVDVAGSAGRGVTAGSAPSQGFNLLTARERQVLRALTEGHAAGRIAKDHQTSLFTVRTHIRSILHKLDVHSQLEAVSLAMRVEWFS